MNLRLRSAVLAVVAALSVGGAPARAADPTVLVASRDDGALVRLDLTGRLAQVKVLVPGNPEAYLIPTQARGTAVSYVRVTERGSVSAYDVGVVDAGTGATRALSRDGRSGHLLVSPDGRYRYVLATTAAGSLVSLVKIDARSGRRTVLLAPVGRPSRWDDVQLSGSGLSPDGRTVYVARTPGMGASELLAVDTATGRYRVIPFTGTHRYILNVVASPDGKTLAVTFAPGPRELDAVSVGLLPVTGGEPDLLTTYGDLFGSSFTRDGSAVVLTNYGYPVGVAGSPGIWLGDVVTGLVTPIAGTESLYQAIPVA